MRRRTLSKELLCCRQKPLFIFQTLDGFQFAIPSQPVALVVCIQYASEHAREVSLQPDAVGIIGQRLLVPPCINRVGFHPARYLDLYANVQARESVVDAVAASRDPVVWLGLAAEPRDWLLYKIAEGVQVGSDGSGRRSVNARNVVVTPDLQAQRALSASGFRASRAAYAFACGTGPPRLDNVN